MLFYEKVEVAHLSKFNIFLRFAFDFCYNLYEWVQVLFYDVIFIFDFYLYGLDKIVGFRGRFFCKEI